MRVEDKQRVSIEIDKYFRSQHIDSVWFSGHIDLSIIRPDDGFEPQSISDIKICQESIELIEKDHYRFTGSGKVLFEDKASNVGSNAEVEFGGEAITKTVDVRMYVDDICLTTFNRVSDIIPKH